MHCMVVVADQHSANTLTRYYDDASEFVGLCAESIRVFVSFVHVLLTRHTLRLCAKNDARCAHYAA